MIKTGALEWLIRYGNSFNIPNAVKGKEELRALIDSCAWGDAAKEEIEKLREVIRHNLVAMDIVYKTHAQPHLQRGVHPKTSTTLQPAIQEAEEALGHAATGKLLIDRDDIVSAIYLMDQKGHGCSGNQHCMSDEYWDGLRELLVKLLGEK